MTCGARVHGRGRGRTEPRTARNERAYDVHHRDAWYALCALQSEENEACERRVAGVKEEFYKRGE